MFSKAQGMFKLLQDRVKSTLQTVAEVAESVGVPSSVTSLLKDGNGQEAWSGGGASYHAPPAASAPRATAEAVPAASRRTEVPRANAYPPPEAAFSDDDADAFDGSEGVESDDESPENGSASAAPRGKRVSHKKRPLEGNREASSRIKRLEVDDEIGGSTYLARIVWSLGVASLEGLGPLRPADIARMVMSRSAVSLEPPNVARYIRRSKPSCIVVDRTEGSSQFYKLNSKGKKLFEEKWGPGAGPN